MAVISDKFPQAQLNKEREVFELLEKKYPDLIVQIYQDPTAYCTTFRFTKRNDPMSTTFNIDATFIMDASPEAIVNSIEHHIKKYHQLKPVVEKKPKTEKNDWAENWIKKNGGVK